MRGRRLLAAAISVPVLGALVFGGSALATTALTSSKVGPPSTAYACVNLGTRSIDHVYTVAGNFPGCGSNEFAVTFGAQGKTGATGKTGPVGLPGTNGTDGTNGTAGANGTNGADGAVGATGPQGPAGPSGPSGVQAVVTQSFNETDSIPTGGSFVGLSTQVGTFALPAGTYEVCVNAKVEQPTAATGTVSPQLFLYDQPKSGSFAGDVLNVSTTTQGGTTHDAYLDGCTIDTEASDATMYLYGFGYDSDSGAGAYNLMGATVTAVKLTPAS